MLVRQLHRLFEGYRAGYVTEMELQQSRRLYLNLLWLELLRWLASLTE